MDGILLRAVEFRSTVEAGDGRTMEGYAAVFNSPTRIRSWEGEFDEEIAPGAFRATLRERTPVLQFDHGRDQRTGTVPIGSIADVREDDQGLFVSARLYDNPVVEPIRQAIEGKSITGMSFRFAVEREEWTDNAGKKVRDDEIGRLLWDAGDRGPLKRRITRINPLHELGPVVFPAYDTTSVGVRSMAQTDPAGYRDLVREVIAELRRNPDLTHLAGRPAVAAGGGDPDATRGAQTSDQLNYDALLLMRKRNA